MTDKEIFIASVRHTMAQTPARPTVKTAQSAFRVEHTMGKHFRMTLLPL